MKTVVLSRLERLQKSIRGFRISNDKELRSGVPPPLWLMTGRKINDDDLQAKTEEFWVDDPVH